MCRTVYNYKFNQIFFKDSIERVNIPPNKNLVRHANFNLFKVKEIAQLIKKIGTSLFFPPVNILHVAN